MSDDTETGHGPNVIFCYSADSSEHVDWVTSLAEAVAAAGANVWIDTLLVPGEDWGAATAEALDTADVAVVVDGLGPIGPWPENELRRLWRRKRLRVIPIVRGPHDEFDGPAWLRQLVSVNMNELVDFDRAFQKLLSGIFHGRDPSPEPSPIRSAQWGPGVAAHLTRIELENVKLFKHFVVDVQREDGTARKWTCVLADNGCGKTTFLQAIALAAMGDTLATKLNAHPRAFVPALGPASPVSIKSKFQSAGLAHLSTELRLEGRSHDWVGAGLGAEQLRGIRRNRLSDFFVAAYGTGRRLRRAGEVAIPADPVMERVQGLFDPEHPLVGLEFGQVLEPIGLDGAFHRIIRRIINAKAIGGERLLPGVQDVAPAETANVPGANKGDIVVTVDLGNGEFQLGPSVLSAGYQSILAWVGELVGQVLLNGKRDVEPEEMEGLVLIDEIDLHLHPTWQRRVVPVLRSVFKKMQFIVTTHSPLVLTGFAAEEIVVLGIDNGRIVKREGPFAEPAMQSASQLLSSYFDTPVASRPGLKEKEREAFLLKNKAQRTPDEQEKLDGLETELEPFWRAPVRELASPTPEHALDVLKSRVEGLGLE